MTSGWRSAPVEIYFPLLLAALLCSAAAPLLHIFLNRHFGMTAGRPAPSMLGFAFVGLVGCWGTRLLVRSRLPGRIAPFVSIVLWVLSLVVAFAVQPHYDVSGALKDPLSLAQTRGYFVVPIFISMAAWWLGARYAMDPGRFAGEEVRGLVQRCWILLTVSIVFAALIGGVAGNEAIDVAKWAVPVCMVASVALVAGAEVQGTRELARRRGVQVPSWRRWYRLTGGFAVAIVLLTLAVTFLLGPGALRALLDGIVLGLRYVGWGLSYILYAIFYVVYVIVRSIGWLFGGSLHLPAAKQVPPPVAHQQQPQAHDQDPWQYALLVKWILLGIALIVVGLIIFRLSRRRQQDFADGAMEEERESVFSADLAKRQLRDLFRRHHGPPPPQRLDLDRPPRSAREAMTYLEVLATREGVGRQEAETAIDFAGRLRGIWSGTAGPLVDLTSDYQDVRYGEMKDADRERIASVWNQIWSRRKPPDDTATHNRAR